MRRTLLLPLLAVVVAVTLLPAATPAAAATCPTPGSVKIKRATGTDSDFTIFGGGWGHGVGMSQYGAQGAARLGCSAGQILRRYYRGVAVRAADTAPPIRVGLTFSGSTTDNRVTALNVDATQGRLPWQLCGAGGACKTVARQPAGTRWQVRVRADGGFRLLRADGSRIFSGGNGRQRLRARLTQPGDSSARIAHLATSNGHRYKWGYLEFRPDGDSGKAFATVTVPSLELYLRGLAEMPSSWPGEALRAQAIVGRSYAVYRRFVAARGGCACHLVDSPSDQAYSGYDKESEGDGVYGSRWVAAVDSSSGRVLRYDSDGDGRVDGADRLAVGYYSSSHGGASESAAFTWGGDVSYLQAVDDSRWDSASDNPYRAWSVGVSAERMGSAFGVGTATAVELPAPKGLRGRIGVPPAYGGVRITGTTGTKTVSGSQFKTVLGLRSTLFSVVERDPCAPPPGTTFDATTRRVAGRRPADTAARVSRAHWSSSRVAILANPNRGVTTLSAPALAARYNAPLLLANRDRLPSQTASELERLGASRVYVLGGTAEISRAVQAQVGQMAGVRAARLAGSNRWATAARIAEKAGAASNRQVALTLGAHATAGAVWQHGSSAANLAATPQRVPTLLVKADDVPAVTRSKLAELGTRRVVLIGGRSLIGDRVKRQLEALGYVVSRRGGADPFATSVAVARMALKSHSTPVQLTMASNAQRAYSPVAGVLATRFDGVTLLGATCDLDDVASVTTFLRDRSADLSRATLVGRTAVISNRVRWQVGEHIRD